LELRNLPLQANDAVEATQTAFPSSSSSSSNSNEAEPISAPEPSIEQLADDDVAALLSSLKSTNR
jgi:hypothetical protein